MSADTPCPACFGSQIGSWRTLCDSHLAKFIRFGHVNPDPRGRT